LSRKLLAIQGGFGVSSSIAIDNYGALRVAGKIGIGANLEAISGNGIATVSGSLGVKSTMALSQGEIYTVSGIIGVVSNVIIQTDSTCGLEDYDNSRWC